MIDTMRQMWADGEYGETLMMCLELVMVALIALMFAGMMGIMIVLVATQAPLAFAAICAMITLFGLIFLFTVIIPSRRIPRESEEPPE